MSRRWLAGGVVVVVLAGCRGILGIGDLTVQGDGGASGDGGSGSDGARSDAAAEAAPPSDSGQGADSVRADSQPPPDAGGNDVQTLNCFMAPDASCTVDGSTDNETCAREYCLNCCIQAASTTTQQAYFVNGQNGGMKMCLCSPGAGPCTTQCNDFCMMGVAHEPICDDCTVHAIIDPAGACSNNRCDASDCMALTACLMSCPVN